ncbi:MAG: HsdM family class I SAM-dependent methyltransferase [Ignavibacteriales bacterium]
MLGQDRSSAMALIKVRARFLRLLAGGPPRGGLCSMFEPGGCPACAVEETAADFCEYVRCAANLSLDRTAAMLLSGRGPATTPLEGPALDLPLESAISAWEDAAEAPDGDSLEALVESRGDRSRRRLEGRYYTAARAVRLMARLALCAFLAERAPSIADDLRQWVGGASPTPRVTEMVAPFLDGIRIVDPACGSGAFLLGSLDGLTGLCAGRGPGPAALFRVISGSLYGADSDAVAVAACRYRLWTRASAGACPAGLRANIECADSLSGDWGSHRGSGVSGGGYDIALLNPPYVRHELLTAELKSRLQREYPGFSPRSDLYVYFFALVERLLKPGGVAAVICPTTWMDVGYGRGVQRYLRERFQVRAVIRSRVERWFPGASVDAGIVLLAKEAPGAPTAMLTLERPLADTPWDLLADAACPGGTRRPATRDAGGAGAFSARIVTAGALASAKWGRLFDEEPLDAVFQANAGRLCRLADIATVRRGFTTGANGFFYVECPGEARRPGYLRARPSGEPPGGREFEIPAGMLLPVIRSPREVRGYEIGLEYLKYRVFVAEGAPAPPGVVNIPAGLDEFIGWGVKRGFDSRPTCSARSLWWRLERPAPPGIVWAMTIRERFFAALNAGALIDARLYGVYPAEGIDPVVLAAILNSSVTWLAAECSCRTYGGGGGPLDTKVYEVRGLPIPDPRPMDPGAIREMVSAFGALRRRPVSPVSMEMGLPDRAALDEAVLVCLGLDHREAAAVGRGVRDLLERRVCSRTRRARNVMDRESTQTP